MAILNLSSKEIIRLKKISLIEEHHLSAEFLVPSVASSGLQEAVYSAELPDEVHPDLKEVFKRLAVHMALVTEYIQDPLIQLNHLKEPYDTQSGHQLFEPFSCRHVSRNWKEQRPGVVLSGVRKLKNKRVVSINTPFVETDPDKSSYPLIQQLLDLLNLLDDEVFQYLAGTKYGAKQLKMQAE
jgi:hypothetical protein